MHYFYFDTSALAKRYSPESGSEKVDSIINNKDNVIIIGNIAIPEIYSALSKKYRTGEISNIVTSDVVLYQTCQSEGLTVINPEQ